MHELEEQSQEQLLNAFRPNISSLFKHLISVLSHKIGNLQ